MKDDAYLNGQARLCGWQATLVYDSLCRHANIGQEAFPSIRLISEELAISRPTVITGLTNLEKYKVIEVRKTRNRKGKWINNSYVLLDKSEWIKIGGEPRNQRGQKQKRDKKGHFTNDTQVNDTDTDKEATRVRKNTNPCPYQYKTQVNDTDTKETHSEGNTYKETHIAGSKISPAKNEENEKKGETEKLPANSEISFLMNIFYEKINSSLNFGNKTQRAAIQWLVDKYGYEKTRQTIEYAIYVQGKDYAPTITTPYQLKDKLSALLVYYKRNNDTSKFGVHITK